ncbi:MAG: hypothetical protein ACYTFQ_18490 [Planctomycetota bacterium]|jgi:hypothetical protein
METKPGFKTSEFWLVLVTVMVAMLAGSGVFGEQHVVARALEIATGVLAAMGYSFSRAMVKKDPLK